MAISNPNDEHNKLSVKLGTYGNDIPSCMVISHGSKASAVTISFERTLRVPDNKVVNNLPPALGQFPLYSVAEYQDRMPAEMVKKGGVFLPMYQREAMWIRFHATEPFALKVYVGGVNAISGVPIKESPEAALKRVQLSDKVKQDYVVLPEQPWLDGIASDDGRIRQFVAMPKGSGYSVEAQVTGEEKIDGMQFELTPVKRGCPDSLNVKVFEQVSFHVVQDKVLNLREKRFSNMSTMLDLKKAIETEFGIAIPDQVLSLGIPNHSFASPDFNNDQLTFAELWFPESSILEVRSRIPVPANSPSPRGGLSPAKYKKSASFRKSSMEDMSYEYDEDSQEGSHMAFESDPATSFSHVPSYGYGPNVLMESNLPPPPAAAPLTVHPSQSMSAPLLRRKIAAPAAAPGQAVQRSAPVQVKAMSLAAGGFIKQSIIADTYPPSIWDTESSIMFNIQLLNSESFMAITGCAPPNSPIDAKTYQQHGYPFFAIWNEELSGIKGDFAAVKSVGDLDESKAKAGKENFWNKLTEESSQGGEGEKYEAFKRDEPLYFPVVVLDMSLTKTFKPLKQMEDEAKRSKEST